MSSMIHIQANNAEGILERVLRTTRHRGFVVQYFEAKVSAQGAMLDITLKVTSERAINLLSNQLEKLIDVVGVETLSEVMQSATKELNYAKSA